jgi:nucleoside-diphosphate-sugar epimerase
MKVFLTGGTGYIGNRILHRLLDEEYEVHALCRNASSRKLDSHQNLRWFDGDITDKKSINKAIQGCDAVIHSAAFARVYSRDRNTYHRQNVQATVNILDAAIANNVRRFVFTSTAGVLGPSNGSPLTEDHNRTLPFNNEYEFTKHEAEQKIREYVKRGLDAVILNPARVYGPGRLDRSNPVSRYFNIVKNSRFGLIPGDGRRIGSYCYVDDIVKGHILALEKGRSGERYILGGENISFNDVVATLEETTGKRKIKIYMPLSLMKGLSSFELLRAKISNYEPWIVPKWVSKYLYDCALDSSKAKNELGYTITPFREGTTKTLEWLEAQQRR